MEDLKTVYSVNDLNGRPEYCEMKFFAEKSPASRARESLRFSKMVTCSLDINSVMAPPLGLFVMPTREMCSSDSIYVLRSAGAK